jgi:putative FmdB family regulatory protein
MPLFEYKCGKCGREFEDLISSDKKDDKRSCPSCSNSDKVMRKVSSFGIQVSSTPGKETLYSPKEIDRAVGKASDAGWEAYNERANKVYKQRQEARRSRKDLKEVIINKGPDGTIRPFEHLGDAKERKFRKEYSEEYKKQIVDTGKDKDKTLVKMKVDL